MTERLFELRQSNKLAAKILVAFFVIALAMVMAFAPPVETVALANEVNQVCAAVGVIVAAVTGSAVAGGMLATAGVTATAAILTGTVSAFIAFLVAMGVGMTVASLIRLLTSESSLDKFGVSFWKTIKDVWDYNKQKVVCTAATFQMICAKIKQALGIDGTAPEPTASDYIFITSAAPTIDDLGLPTLNSWTLEEDKLPKPLTGVASIGSLYYGKSGQEAQKTTYVSNYYIGTYRTSGDIYGNIGLVVDDATYAFTTGVAIQESCGFVSIPIVNKASKSCWFIASEAWQTAFAGGYRSSIAKLKINGSDLKTYSGNTGEYCYYSVSNGYLVAYVVDDNGKIIKPKSVENFLYYTFYLGYRPAFAYGDSKNQDKTILDNHSNIKDMSDADYKKVTTESSDLRKTRTRNKDVTYNSKKDRTKSITDAIKSTGKTDVKGKVTLDSVGLSESTAIDTVKSLDVSDVIGVVGVSATDLAVTDTATGEETKIDAPAEESIPFDLGPKLIKSSAEGIADKFPFCLPKFLYNQLNILVADAKDPKFKIPFKVESANLSGDIDLDLTMSGKAKTVTKITDFFLCAALLVGLVFATKKLEF